MKRRIVVLCGLGCLGIFLASCSSPTKSSLEAKKEAPPEPVTGRQAFYQMFPGARSWAADATPLRLRSIPLQEVKSSGGKAGAWQAIFVSPGTGRSRTYSYSIVEAPGNLHEGVFAEAAGSYSGPSAEGTPFPVAAIKFDSDQAYEEAVKHNAAYIKKNPDQPVNFVLELTNRYPDVCWRVYWGNSASSAPSTVFVDASTGKFLNKVP